MSFRSHEKSASHYEAVEVIVTLPLTTRDIGEQLSQQHAAQKLKNLQALHQIISCIRLWPGKGWQSEEMPVNQMETLTNCSK